MARGRVSGVGEEKSGVRENGGAWWCWEWGDAEEVAGGDGCRGRWWRENGEKRGRAERLN